MFPWESSSETIFLCFLCMRRDVSILADSMEMLLPFSLHAQRCFSDIAPRPWPARVFSACAEMFLRQRLMNSKHRCFLCMRRDVSKGTKPTKPKTEFSLHAQRCFFGIYIKCITSWVFSACAEMFLKYYACGEYGDSFLCMRRDVSCLIVLLLLMMLFSLHAQRCFCYYFWRRSS